MRIASIETFRAGDHLALVRVRTDEGHEGIGQTSPYIAGATTQALHQLVAPFFLGRDPWDLEVLVDTCVRENYKYLGTTFYRALCGVDTALWDLLGKQVGRPVAKLLGGEARSAIPMYASSLSRASDVDAELARFNEHIEQSGFKAVKLKVGDVMGRDRDAFPGRTREIIEKALGVLGDGITLLADANGAYTAKKAIEVGRMLEQHGFSHFEEPCQWQDLASTRRVADALDIAVAGGEQDNAIPTFFHLISSGVVDIVQPDIGYVGGVSRARKVAITAETAGIPCTPHCANTSLLQVFTAHLAVAMPSATQFQEWSIEETPWTSGIYDPMPVVRDGCLEISDRPGWGVDINPDFLARAEHAESRLS